MTKRQIRAIDLVCRECGAKSGRPCKSPRIPHTQLSPEEKLLRAIFGETWGTVPRARPHAARYADRRAWYTHETTLSTQEIQRDRALVIAAYIQARESGNCPDTSAQYAWDQARRLSRWALSRAPDWNECLDVNTSCRRVYRSPLGTALAITGPYGSHSGEWPRTAQSLDQAREVRTAVILYLERSWIAPWTAPRQVGWLGRQNQNSIRTPRPRGLIR